MRSIFLAVALIACNNGGDGNNGNDTDPGGDDTSSSTDSGSSNVECGDSPSTPAPGSGSATCLTADLQCGDSVTHTTTGGNTDLEAGYQSGAWACIGSDPLTADYSAPERRYKFTSPGDSEAVATLESGCDLTMKVVQTSNSCPADGTQVNCWDAEGDFDERVQTHTFYPGLDYEIIIEGVDGGEGAFTLSIACP